jgi:hypothetical protein
VRDFLLERLREIARGHDFIHVEDDVHTNAAFVDSVIVNNTRVTFFQGTNILVKVDGTDDGTKCKRYTLNNVFES